MTPGPLNMTRPAWHSWDLLTGLSFLLDLTAGTCTTASEAEEWDIYVAEARSCFSPTSGSEFFTTLRTDDKFSCDRAIIFI